jgi:hypothetical protein
MPQPTLSYAEQPIIRSPTLGKLIDLLLVRVVIQSMVTTGERQYRPPCLIGDDPIPLTCLYRVSEEPFRHSHMRRSTFPFTRVGWLRHS